MVAVMLTDQGLTLKAVVDVARNFTVLDLSE